MIEFFLGYLCGVLSLIVYGVYRVSRIAAEDVDKEMGEALGIKPPTPAEAKVDIREKIKAKILSVRDRLGEVYAISQRQSELQAAMDMPAQNALHSKHKNGIFQELRNLEDKKHAILESILKDGVDPKIRVLNEDGSQVEMKLSEFVARNNGAEPLNEGELPPGIAEKNEKPAAEKDEIDEELEKIPRKAGKFTVHTGSGGKKPPTNH
jgi:hypothetical protein